MSKIADMTEEEYKTYNNELQKLDKWITHKSLLIGVIDENTTICPYCDGEFGGIMEIRKKLLQLMEKYNKFVGRKYYVAHIEGNKKWEL